MADYDLQSLIDRTAISEVVYRYATAVDTRDWPLYRSCFMDNVEIDFSSWNPEAKAKLSSDQWTQMVKEGVSGFEATQHMSSNHVHTIDGDRAVCVSYMQAEHFLQTDGGTKECTLGGYYTNELIRTGDGWKIRKCTLTVTWSRGDYGVFAMAAARYAATAEGKP